MNRRVGVYLFALFQGLYALTASGNIFRVPDEFESYFQVERFVDAGDLSVPQTLALQRPFVVNGAVEYGNLFFGKVAADGKPYAPYGPLSSLLSIGHHLAARGLASLLGIERQPAPNGMGWLYFVATLTSLATSTAAALAVVGFHRAALALGATPPGAIVLSCLLGCASVLWPYGTVFYSEAFLAAAFIWAAAWLLEVRQGAPHAARRVAGAAALIAVAGLTKPTSLIVAPAFVLAALLESGDAAAEHPWRDKRRWSVAGALTVGAAVAALFHLTWNLTRFGNPMDFGYDWAETIPTMPYRPFRLEELPRGLFVLLLSPGKSLFVWTPALVPALFRARALWRSHRGLIGGLALAAATGLIFYGTYMFPEGGYAHGPRHLVPIIPLLLLPLAVPLGEPLSRSTVRTCAAIGVVMAALAVSVSYLEDQAMGTAASQQQLASYYERISPAPGRPWNRYNIEYVPFLKTLTTRGWLTSPVMGTGPDFIPRLLDAARRSAPGGADIPGWFVRVLPLPWIAMMLWAGLRLRAVWASPGAEGASV